MNSDSVRAAFVTMTAMLVVVFVFQTRSAQSSSATASDATAKPLLLEKSEGERRVFRGWPGHPDPGSTFALKIDPKNGGSSHLVFGTEDLPPGETIPTHRHPGSDEILFLQTGTARLHLGDSVREVHGGSTVFIPADTWISVSNIGRDVINVAFVFSAPGFEDFMRAESVQTLQVLALAFLFYYGHDTPRAAILRTLL